MSTQSQVTRPSPAFVAGQGIAPDSSHNSNKLMMVRRYSELLRQTRLTSTFALVSAGRLGYAALPLCLLFSVRQATGSFTMGPLVLSIVAITSLTMPVKAKFVDRYSQRTVLPILGLSSLLCLGATVIMGAAHVSQAAPWIVGAALIGLANPPLGPCMRAQWRLAAPQKTHLAYGLDSAAEETIWLLGPLAAGLALSRLPAWQVLAVVPVFLLLGSLALAGSRFGRRAANSISATARAGVRQSALPLIFPALLVMLVFGAMSAALITGIAARADAIHRLDLAGLAEAGVGLGAVIGGLLAGMLPPPGLWPRRLAATLTGMGCSLVVAATLDLNYLALGAFVAVGLFSAPVWVIVYNAVDHMVSDTQRTEATTWVSTAANIGSALGTALTGALVAWTTPTTPHWTAALLGLATAGLCLTIRTQAPGAD